MRSKKQAKVWTIQFFKIKEILQKLIKNNLFGRFSYTFKKIT